MTWTTCLKSEAHCCQGLGVGTCRFGNRNCAVWQHCAAAPERLSLELHAPLLPVPFAVRRTPLRRLRQLQQPPQLPARQAQPRARPQQQAQRDRPAGQG